MRDALNAMVVRFADARTTPNAAVRDKDNENMWKGKRSKATIAGLERVRVGEIMRGWERGRGRAVEVASRTQR